MKFQAVQCSKGEWFGRIVAENGRKLFHSENYKRRGSAVNALVKVMFESRPKKESDIEFCFVPGGVRK